MILDQAKYVVTCVAARRGVAQIITSSVDGKVGSLVLSIAPFIVGLFLFINFYPCFDASTLIDQNI